MNEGFEWDENKRQSNIAERGVDFRLVDRFRRMVPIRRNKAIHQVIDPVGRLYPDAWEPSVRVGPLAALIFENPVIDSEDTREDYGEQRFRALGHVGEEYFIVAYTWRGPRRRIISAWKVGNDGKKRYEAILARRAEGNA